MRRLFHPTSLIVCILGLERFKWFRQWHGGHWERWYIDFPVCSDIWIQFDECNIPTGKRPGLGRGRPVCEIYVVRQGTIGQ